MKNVIVSLFLTLSFLSFDKIQKDNPIPKGAKLNSARLVESNEEHKTIKFYGNVDFEINDLKIKAEQILIDNKTNQIIATGLKEFDFRGKVSSSKNSKNHTLKYTIGEGTIYIE